MTSRPDRTGGGGTNRSNPRPASQPQGTNSNLESTLIRVAGIAFLATEVMNAIKHMHDMKPDQQAVLKAAERWYEASKNVGDSLDELKLSYISLAVHWEGAAYTAFQDHMKDNVIAATEQNESTLFEIGNALIGVHNAVVTYYNQAVQHFGQTVARAITLEGEWQATKGETKEIKRQQLFSVVDLFVQGMTTRRTEVDKAMADHAAAITALRGKVLQFRSPGKTPPEIREKGNWDRT